MFNNSRDYAHNDEPVNNNAMIQIVHSCMKYSGFSNVIQYISNKHNLQ